MRIFKPKAPAAGARCQAASPIGRCRPQRERGGLTEHDTLPMPRADGSKGGEWLGDMQPSHQRHTPQTRTRRHAPENFGSPAWQHRHALRLLGPRHGAVGMLRDFWALGMAPSACSETSSTKGARRSASGRLSDAASSSMTCGSSVCKVTIKRCCGTWKQWPMRAGLHAHLLSQPYTFGLLQP